MKLIRRIIHDLLMIIIPKSFRKNSLTCKQVSEIIACKPELSRLSKIKLHMHLFICQSCLNYKNELSTLEKAAGNLGELKLTDEQLKKLKISKTNIIDSVTKE